jgi:hypothetical protein
MTISDWKTAEKRQRPPSRLPVRVVQILSGPLQVVQDVWSAAFDSRKASNFIACGAPGFAEPSDPGDPVP